MLDQVSGHSKSCGLGPAVLLTAGQSITLADRISSKRLVTSNAPRHFCVLHAAYIGGSKHPAGPTSRAAPFQLEKKTPATGGGPRWSKAKSIKRRHYGTGKKKSAARPTKSDCFCTFIGIGLRMSFSFMTDHLLQRKWLIVWEKMAMVGRSFSCII